MRRRGGGGRGDGAEVVQREVDALSLRYADDERTAQGVVVARVERRRTEHEQRRHAAAGC